MHSDQVCHPPVWEQQGFLSEDTDLNMSPHQMFVLHRIFTGFKSLKQGHNRKFESKTTELLIAFKSQ